MSWLPSRLESWDRLKAAHPPGWVLRHCRAVEALSVAMADAALATGHEVNQALVARGALLHDIGRSITQDIHHAHVGADLLRPEWPEEVALIVERHTGAGLDALDAADAGLPARDYMPQTIEQRIVAHADNLYSGDNRLSLAAIEAKYEAKGLEGAWRRIEALHNALCQELAVDLESLAPATLDDLP